MYIEESSNEVSVWVEVIASCILNVVVLFEVYLVTKKSADSTEALDKLESFLGFIGNELHLGPVILVVVTEPLSQVVLADYIQIGSSGLIFKVLLVVFLGGVQIEDLCITLDWVFDYEPCDIEVFE